MTIRCVLVDGVLDLAIDDVDIDVRVASSPLDLGGQAPHEVLVVSADEELLAEAGRLGAHRLLAAGRRGDGRRRARALPGAGPARREPPLGEASCARDPVAEPSPSADPG